MGVSLEQALLVAFPVNPEAGGLLDPRIDFVFKRLFGSRPESRPLLALCNAIFSALGLPLLSGLVVRNPLIDPRAADVKGMALDIRAEATDGTHLNIEMQMTSHKHFLRRSLFYWATLYQEQLGRGDAYHELRPTIAINLCNFTLSPDAELLALYEAHDQRRGLALSDHFRIVAVELPKWQRAKVPAPLQAWLDLLMLGESDVPFSASDQDSVIREVLHMLDDLSQDREARAIAFRRRLWEMDQRVLREVGREEGFEEGYEEGKQQGFQKGREEGREEGRQEGLDQGITNGKTLEARSIFIRLFERRFGSPTPETMARINEAPLDLLGGWLDALLTATGPKEVFRDV